MYGIPWQEDNVCRDDALMTTARKHTVSGHGIESMQAGISGHVRVGWINDELYSTRCETGHL